MGLYIHQDPRGGAPAHRKAGAEPPVMIAALIFVVSFAVLLQFFVSYSRTIIAAYRKSELSEQVREVVGIEDQKVGSEEFGRLVQLDRKSTRLNSSHPSISYAVFCL